jgi:glycosyltransferase involved in cell wall biosynthesis
VLGDGGVIVERDDKGVGDALMRLATDRDLRLRFGCGTLERSADYTWEASVASVLDIYRSLLSDRELTRL